MTSSQKYFQKNINDGENAHILSYNKIPMIQAGWFSDTKEYIS